MHSVMRDSTAGTTSPGRGCAFANEVRHSTGMSSTMRNRIVGSICVLWGGAVVAYSLTKGGPQGQGAYTAGQTAGTVFGVVLLAVGLYYLVKGVGAKAGP